jgi:hypothetical protein
MDEPVGRAERDAGTSYFSLQTFLVDMSFSVGISGRWKMDIAFTILLLWLGFPRSFVSLGVCSTGSLITVLFTNKEKEGNNGYPYTLFYTLLFIHIHSAFYTHT